jgi:hypothetical protein
MQVIPVEIDGMVVHVEVIGDPLVDAELIGAEGFAPAGDPAKELANRVDQMARSGAAMCKKVYEQMVDGLGNVKPDELALEFGLAIGGEAGIPVVTKVTGEATFKVSATWNLNA